MNPICDRCCSEMKCDKNGVVVAPIDHPDHKRSGDRFKCRTCENTVVINFSGAFNAQGDPDILLV